MSKLLSSILLFLLVFIKAVPGAYLEQKEETPSVPNFRPGETRAWMDNLLGLSDEERVQFQVQLYKQEQNRHFVRGPIHSFYDAAEQGNVAAQLNLVFRYDTGLADFEGMTDEFDYSAIKPENRDYCLMQYWLSRAARSGDQSALAWSSFTSGYAYFDNSKGFFDEANHKRAYFYTLKWGEYWGFTPNDLREISIFVKGQTIDPKWLDEYASWSLDDVPIPPRVSCRGCPFGQAEQCRKEIVESDNN